MQRARVHLYRGVQMQFTDAVIGQRFFNKDDIRNATLSEGVMQMVRKSFMPEVSISAEGKVTFYQVGEHVVIDSVEPVL